MRIVGNQNGNEIELDPAAAYVRGRRWEAMLRAAQLPGPRGVTRGSQDYFQRIDEARMLKTARRIHAMTQCPMDE